jgi:hypothetical protein
VIYEIHYLLPRSIVIRLHNYAPLAGRRTLTKFG